MAALTRPGTPHLTLLNHLYATEVYSIPKPRFDADSP